MAEALSAIEGFIGEGGVHQVWTANVSTLVEWRSNQTLRDAYRSAAMITIDGMGLYYSGRLLRKPVREAVSGSSLFVKVLELANSKRYSVFLLGAEDDVLCDASDWVVTTYPDVRIAGAHHGYFGVDAAGDVADLIRLAAPDVLLLGMSSPLKERFALDYASRMGVPVTLGVGGSFDIAARRRRRAPRWVQVICLEWLWRLGQEPGRLWRRYASTNTVFLGLLARELAGRKRAGWLSVR